MRLRSAAAALGLIACPVVVPLVGVGVAEASRPVILPASALPQNAAVQPPPAPPAERRDLSSSFELLPVVDSGAPGARPRPFLAQYLTVMRRDDAAGATLLN